MDPSASERPPSSGPAPASPWPFRLALLLVLLFNLNNVVWLCTDDHVLLWDENSHYKRSVKTGFFLLESHGIDRVGKEPVPLLTRLDETSPALAYAARAPVTGYAGVLGGLYGGPKHPPLVYLVAAPVNYLAGSTDAGVAVSALVFSAVLILSLFSMGRRFSNGWGGLLAAFLAASTPLFYENAQRFLLDAPLAAMTALAFAAYFASEGFGRRRESALFGLAFGLGLLTKEIFPVFAGLLLVLGLVRGWRAWTCEGDAARLKNLAVAAAAAFGTAGFWWAPYGPGLLGVFRKHQHMGSIERDPAWFEAAGALYYVTGLALQASLLYAAAFLPCLVAFFVRHGRRPASWAVALWLAGPLVFFTLIANKDHRYTLACMPAVALVVGSTVASIRPRALAALAAALLVAGGAVQAGFVYWGTPALPDWSVPRTPATERFGIDGLRVFPAPARMTASKPSQAVDGIIGLLEEARREAEQAGKRRLVIRYLHDLPELKTPLDHHFLRDNLFAQYAGGGVELYMRITIYKPGQVDGADYVIVKESGPLGPPFLEPHLAEAVAYFRERAGAFSRVGSFRHHDGSEVTLYRRIG